MKQTQLYNSNFLNFSDLEFKIEYQCRQSLRFTLKYILHAEIVKIRISVNEDDQ